jgi:lysophospholipase L1-like esterase
MFPALLPAVSPAKLRAATRLQRIRHAARAARQSNPRNAGLHPGAVTITDNGATLPAATSASYPFTAASKGVWTVNGGAPFSAGGGNFRFASAVIWTSGGNAGTGDGKQCNFWRASAMCNGRYLALRLGPTTAAYRILIDDRYVAMSGTVLGVTSGLASQFLLLDFGARAIRKVTVEGQQTCSFAGAYTEASAKLWAVSDADMLRATFIGDSYVHGSAATHLGDGIAPVMGDWLGVAMHASGSASGTGSTGWAASTTAYRFDERIANGDIGLNGAPPDLLFMMASVTDRAKEPAVITANALAGLRTARAHYPETPIVMFGCLGASYVGTVLANEAAVQAAVTQLADPLAGFVPVSTDPLGAWVSGSGRIGSPANDGNSDWVTIADGTHPSDEGCAYIGRRYAGAALACLSGMYGRL